MTSIISSISLKNFKGFSEEVRIELRPITLLFGANSAGKSSVLHALQYVREILERNNANADRTAQGGEAIDLGGFINLVHGREVERKIEIELGMTLGSNSIPELVPDAFEDWQTQEETVWSVYNTLQDIRNRVETVSLRLTIEWNALREEPVIVAYEVGTNGSWCLKLEASGDGRDARMRINHENSIFMVDAPEANALLADLDDWISPQDLAGDSDIDAREQLSAASGTEALGGTPVAKTQQSILPDVLYAVQEAGLDRPGKGLRAWLTGFNGALPKIGEMLRIPASGAKGADNIYIVREFTAFLSWLTVGPAMLLRDQLRMLRYIGPLRRVPPRGLEVSLTKSEAGWSDGMAAWEALLAGPQSLVDGSSEWMSNPDKLGTGYKLERKRLQDFDVSTGDKMAVGRPRRRIALVDSTGLSHQPQDIGVGISQVLPVVVAAQDRNASVVCVEQPELHVHPAVQVGLGDLFIDGAVNHGLSFLIETHSEHLILRLLRRVREAASANPGESLPAGSLAPTLIGVNYLNVDEGRVSVTSLPINLEGDFDKPWPKGFFEERGPELF